jgi:magnesium transporter
VKARILDHGAIRATTDPSEIERALAAGQPTWIDVGEHTAEADAFLANVLHLHPLTIEDVWAPRSAPKLEEYTDYVYAIIHGMRKVDTRIELVELDVIVGKSFVLTHDHEQIVTASIAADLDRAPRLLERGVAWLAHAVLDRVVDAYVPLVDQIDADIDALGDEVLELAGTPRGPRVLARVLAFKRTLQDVRRMSAHQREVLLRLARGGVAMIPDDTLPFYRDVYDHFLRIHDLVEQYRDSLTSALEVYLSAQSNRLNEVMKTLTVIATVFMPVTFIAGVYGMNFPDIPEIHWAFGYPFALLLMAATTGVILWFFYKRGWIWKKL